MSSNDDLLQRLKNSHRAIARVKLGDVELGLRVLTEADRSEAGQAALGMLKDAGREDVNLATSDLFEAEKALQLLARAVVNPDSGERLFESVSAAKESLTRDQKNALVEAYVAHEQAVSPRPELMTQEAFDSLFEALKKTPDPALLSNLSTATLKRLVLSLAVPQPS